MPIPIAALLATTIACHSSAPTPIALQVAPDPVKFQIQYDTDKPPGAANWVETVANLIYPPGKGPVSFGYPAGKLPVILMLRGGNSNFIDIGELEYDVQTEGAAPFGFLGITTNMPIVTNGKDYNVAGDAVARLIQYVRWQASDLNADPDRIILAGRSFGCVVAYSVAYRYDYKDLSSGKPELQFSSRPDYLVARFGPSHLPCFGEDISSWAPTMSLFFFPDKAFEDASYAERLSESPTWWLLNPELFGRTSTPITCVVFHQAYTDKCATNNDVHSGLFGDLMLSALRDYSDQTGDLEIAEKAFAIDLATLPEPSPLVTAWAVERMAEDGSGLWMTPPTGVVNPTTGGTIKLDIFGAKPGDAVDFYRSKTTGPAPLPGCPGVSSGLSNAQFLGQALANNQGRASLSYVVSGAELGTIDYLQAIEAGDCATSQVQVHRYF